MAHKVGAIIILDALRSQSPPENKRQRTGLRFPGVFRAQNVVAGIGVLYGKKELLEKMEPFQFGGGMINEVTFEKST